MAKPKKGAKMTTTTKAAPAKKAAAKAPEKKERVRNRAGGMEGTPWTDADYAAAGYRRVTLRLAKEPAQLLAKLEATLGATATEVIRQALDELAKALARKGAR